MLAFLLNASRLALTTSLGWAAKHPVITSTAAVGTLDAATNGLTTDYVVKPLAKGVIHVGKGVGGGVVDAGKSIVLGDERRGEETPAQQDENSPGGMAQKLQETVSPYMELMGQNGAYALPAAFAALKFANGGGSVLQNAFNAAAVGTVMALVVKVAESYGFKLPGISMPFNNAAAGVGNTVQPAPEPLGQYSTSEGATQQLKPLALQPALAAPGM